MNDLKLENTTIKAYHSQHGIIGLECIKWVINISLPEIKVCYKDLVLEKYVGNAALKLIKQFHLDMPKNKHLLDSEVCDLCCDIVNKDIKQKTRNEYVVFGRALFFHYFKEFSDYSLARMAGVFHQDHATVIHSLNKIVDHKNEGYLLGWRKTMKLEFEKQINIKHKKSGINNLFKITELINT